MALQGKYVHIALPGSLALEILHDADRLKMLGFAAVETIHGLLNLGDRNLVHRV